jgi:hypothetical protein
MIPARLFVVFMLICRRRGNIRQGSAFFEKPGHRVFVGASNANAELALVFGSGLIVEWSVHQQFSMG